MAGHRPARHCLVVDDSRVIRRIARTTLEKAGLAVSEATNGLEALVACRTNPPDCIVLD